MMVKKRLNDTKYVLQKSARSDPFVVHVDRMWRFHSNLSRDKVKDLSRISTLQNSSPQLTGADKLTPVDTAKLDKPIS